MTASARTEKPDRPDEVSAIAPPMQDRSRRSLDRMLGALESLLKEKPFDKITIAELAGRAEVSVGSIYVRFADKQALLVGMHRRIHERAEACRQRLVDPKVWQDEGIEAISRAAIQAAIAYYGQHGDVFRAMAASPAMEGAEWVVREIEDFKIAMGDLVMIKVPSADRDRVRRWVDASVRMVVSTMMFRCLNRLGVADVVSDENVAEELEAMVQAFMQQATAPT